MPALPSRIKQVVALAATQLVLACAQNETRAVVAALQRDLSPTERVVAAATTTFEIIDRQVVRAKIVNTATGNIRQATVDTRDNTPTSYEQLRTQARSALRRQNGAASADLVERLLADAESPLSVDVEVSSPQYLDAVKRELASLGVIVLSTHRRVITVRGRPEQIRKITTMVRVNAVVPHQERRNLSLDIARELDQQSVAAAHSVGVGTNFLAAVWELDACVRREHPTLRASRGSHASAAPLVASPTRLGTAPK